MTGGAIFLYGPTGNGKTSIAERLSRIYHDSVYIPYAVEISGHVLNVFDAISHRPLEEQPEDVDPRWILCERPFLKVGGELRADMLDPHIDESSHITWAPIQMKANNGILLIDDLGRQQIQPTALLNRWIVPLDRHVDYFSVWSGVTFEVPFELILVFATNLDVSTLAEEAFLRRIRNKIKVDMIGAGMFLDIMQRHCRQRGIEYREDVGERVADECLKRSPGGLRGCYPKDLIDILTGIAKFERRPARFAHEDLSQAMDTYFMR